MKFVILGVAAVVTFAAMPAMAKKVLMARASIAPPASRFNFYRPISE
jgi:hypothetical protein